MRMRMCVYVYVHVYVCMYVCMCVYVYVCVCTCSCVHICIQIMYICVCACVHRYICAHVCVRLCVSVWARWCVRDSVCMRPCVYLGAHACVCVHDVCVIRRMIIFHWAAFTWWLLAALDCDRALQACMPSCHLWSRLLLPSCLQFLKQGATRPQ